MTTTVAAPLDLLDRVGEQLGIGSWYDVTQERVDTFAKATGDWQWIHTDPERAASGPFGGTIAHGYLTLSLIAPALSEVLVIENCDVVINYGLNRVRFPAPVPVGSRIRATVTLASAQPRDGGIETALAVTVDVENSSRPACVAEVLVRYR